MANYSCVDKLKATLEFKQPSFRSPLGKRGETNTNSKTNVYSFLGLLVFIFLMDVGFGDMIWAKQQNVNFDVWISCEWSLYASAPLLAMYFYLGSRKGKNKTSTVNKSFPSNAKNTRPRSVGKAAPLSLPSLQKPSFSSQKSRTLLEHAAQNGDVERAQALFREMEQSGMRPDAVTPNIVMRAFTKKGDLAGAERWLAEMKAKRMDISACTYNTILDACAKLDKPELCEKWFSRMHEDGVSPSPITFATLIAAHARQGDEEKAEALLVRMKAVGVPADAICYNALIHACSMRGNFKGVGRWVDEMEEAGLKPSVTTFTAAIDACAKKGRIEEAESWMKRMQATGLQPNVVSYSSLMDACAKVGKPERAGFWYDKMLEVGVTPNSYTFSAAIAACGKAGDVAAAEVWLARAQAANNGVASDPVLYSCTIDACAKVNDADRAWRVFEQMQSHGVRPHIVTYATLARPFAQRGDYQKVDEIEQMMVAEGVAINEYFLYAQLTAYGKARPRQGVKASQAFKKGLAQGLQINEHILDALRRVIGRNNAIALHKEAKSARKESPQSVADIHWSHS